MVYAVLGLTYAVLRHEYAVLRLYTPYYALYTLYNALYTPYNALYTLNTPYNALYLIYAVLRLIYEHISIRYGAHTAQVWGADSELCGHIPLHTSLVARSTRDSDQPSFLLEIPVIPVLKSPLCSSLI